MHSFALEPNDCDHNWRQIYHMYSLSVGGLGLFNLGGKSVLQVHYAQCKQPFKLIEEYLRLVLRKPQQDVALRLAYVVS